MTAQHPVYSLDRGDFVAAGELSAGERLATLAGPTAVLGIQPQHTPQTVYNLEVQGKHVFRVTSNGLLVHNSYADDIAKLAGDTAKKIFGKAPRGTVSSLDDVIGGINHNADVATELARRAVARGRVTDSAQGFGSRAHKYFERLNKRLNNRLVDEGSNFRLVREQFRDAAGDVAGRRARGSIGPDVFIRDLADSSFMRIFDLKTHGGIERLISAARQNQFLQRFGVFAEEIFRLR